MNSRLDSPPVSVLFSEEDPYGGYPSMTPIVPVAPRINIQNLIAESCIESGWDLAGRSGAGQLNSVQASQALCGLSQQVDRWVSGDTFLLEENSILVIGGGFF